MPRRGRPLLMQRPMLIERIRRLALRPQGLFRIHQTHSDLYARARRQFGSWAAAVGAAGVDYASAVRRARVRSVRSRRRARRARTA